MRQLPLDLGHRAALDGADFLVAPSNAAAVAWLDRWPDWPAPALVLAGPPGSGKTHLAHVFRARSAAILVAAPALAVANVWTFLAAAVVLDEAERAEEEALLHLFNLVAERRGHLLMLARQAPAHWPIKLADLRSRLLAAPLVVLEPPDDGLLGAVLVKLFADRQLVAGAAVVAYLVNHLERSFAAAREAVAAIDRAALAARRRRVTLPLVREVLQDDGRG